MDCNRREYLRKKLRWSEPIYSSDLTDALDYIDQLEKQLQEALSNVAKSEEVVSWMDPT